MWSPIHVGEITELESVMRRFNKGLPGLKHMEYGEQLNRLKSMTLEKRRLFANTTFIFKLKAGLCSISVHELGLSLVQSCTRGVDVWFNQLRPSSTKLSSLFQCRAVSDWNTLPLTITSCKTLEAFRNALKKILAILAMKNDLLITFFIYSDGYKYKYN